MVILAYIKADPFQDSARNVHIVKSGVSLRCARSIVVRTSRYSRLKKSTLDLLTSIFMLKALIQCIPGISAVGRSSLLAERSSFSLISCSTLSIFVTNIYRFFLRGSFFSDDTQIRTTEDEA